MVIRDRGHTADDLWELSHQAEEAYELVAGEFVLMSPTGGLHGYVTMEIGALLRNHVRAHKLGMVTAAETGFILKENPQTVRAPDAAFISQARVPKPLPSKYFNLAPDLAVEVVSPGDTAKDIRERVDDFLNAGTNAVWLIYPGSDSVDIHTLTDKGILVQTLEADAVLSGDDIVAGFAVQVSDLFPPDSE